jgi:hypothetical protein
MTNMYNDYTFTVEAIKPSGLLRYQSGHATSARQFLVPCRYAEQFALRQIGKYLVPGFDETPVLPAPFPQDATGVIGYGQLDLIASGFTIDPVTDCCFNVRYTDGDDTDRLTNISDPTSLKQMEKYFHTITDEYIADDVDRETALEEENSECDCMVTITYEENPCDCVFFNSSTGEWEQHEFLLPNTCISVERNPAYEMFTLPNAALIWKDLPDGDNRQLKADSYAYKLIPKADIIVSWHNVPVRHLCAIENHLREFRGAVNSTAWGDVLFCDADSENPAACGCGQYEPETIMFVDYQEDRSQRTDCFGVSQDWNMNTTTLKLFFKQKRIERQTPTASYSDSDDCPDDNDLAYGWNHLFLDRTAEEGGGQWARVAIAGGDEDPVFPIKSFNTILYPIL